MKYVAFFGIIIPFQLVLVVSVLRVIRRRRLGGETDSWLLLSGKVFLLMLAVNIVSIVAWRFRFSEHKHARRRRRAS